LRDGNLGDAYDRTYDSHGGGAGTFVAFPMVNVLYRFSEK
jgi:hypothetical protein